MIKTTKEYYEKKSEHIQDIFSKKVQDNIDNYEAFVNIPVTKSMIRLKYEYDLEYKTAKDVNSSISEEDIIDMTIDEAMNSLVYSSLIKTNVDKEKDVFVSTQMPKSSSSQIRDIIDYVATIKYKDAVHKHYNGVKYLFFGEKHIPFIPNLINTKDINDGYVGKYRGIKFFYMQYIEDIYMSNMPFIDLNTINVKYNEYILEKFDNIFGPEALIEEVPANMKRGVMTINCSLGVVKLIKLHTVFGQGKIFSRILKIERILKNEIGI